MDYRTVDEQEDVGAYTSLEIDSAGRPHISYHDFFNASLKYADFDGTDWQFETVDPDRVVGRYSTLALDATGLPRIAYYDFSNNNLKYAAFDGEEWQIETVDDSPGDVGWDISLVLDAAGRPHISYYRSTSADLKYAAFDGTAWQIEIVDATEIVGRYTSLALDSDGLPHISYYDETNGDLKYTVSTFNDPPTVDAGDDYSGAEGSPVTLQATTLDPESDDLTTAWTYEINSADAGTTCTFADPSQVATTFTCTDDGSFTISLSANDGINPPVIDTATVTISNIAPAISETTATRAGNQVTIAVSATDPGSNDVLSYAFDCDANGAYEVDAGATPTTVCALNPQQEGAFTFGVQVSDDDGGIATDTATVTIATELCANNYTGVLRYSADCRNHETAVTIPGAEPVTVCASVHNGLLRAPANGLCAGHETTYVLPEDGPLSVCVSNYTQTMRVEGDLNQCAGHEFGRVIAATEIEPAIPPRSR